MTQLMSEPTNGFYEDDTNCLYCVRSRYGVRLKLLTTARKPCFHGKSPLR